MRSLAVLLTLLLTARVFAAEPAPVTTAAPQRSLLSGVGVGLIGLGVGSLGFSVGQFLVWNENRRTQAFYVANGTSSVEAPGVAIVQQRTSQALVAGIITGAAGAALLAGGIIALAVDQPAASASLFFSPAPGGALVGVTARL